MTTTSLSRTLCAALLVLTLAAASARAQFSETFAQSQPNRSLYVKDGAWKKFMSGKNKQPAGNTAIVRQDEGVRFVTLVAKGDDTANARAYRDMDITFAPGKSATVTGDIRFATPGTQNDRDTPANIAFNASRDGTYDQIGRLSFGIRPDGGSLVLFITYGKSTTLTSRPEQVKINPEAWYRFSVTFETSSGKLVYSVHELGQAQPKLVWSGDNMAMELYKPVTFSQINLLVTRAGRNVEANRSADFANIAVE